MKKLATLLMTLFLFNFLGCTLPECDNCGGDGIIEDHECTENSCKLVYKECPDCKDKYEVQP